MGQNLILNMADHGFVVCAYNRTTSKVDDFLRMEAKGKSIVGAHSLREFVSKLKKPRRVMMLVQGKGKIVIESSWRVAWHTCGFIFSLIHLPHPFARSSAGKAVDQFIDQLVELLEAGDIIIDGGNSEHADTTRRCASLREKGILYVGSGVSGGEEGARYGPSLMPGGHVEAWPHIKPIFQVKNVTTCRSIYRTI